MRFKIENELHFRMLVDFLKKVDKIFPVPISQKQNIEEYAKKVSEKADIYVNYEDNMILSAVIGYTKNIVNNMAYISVVATLPEESGSGRATGLINEFINLCDKKNISAVHLYTVSSNKRAVRMYSKIGFKEWKINDECRPDDLHLIYYVRKKESKL